MANPWYIKNHPNGQWEVIYDRPVVQESAPPSPEFTSVNEQNRTYVFPNGKVALEGVVSINVSKSGTHRINTTDGKKHIISPGWLHIEFDAAQWTF